jgi:hypothetical protein
MRTQANLFRFGLWRFHAGWLSCRMKPNKQKAMSLILSDVVYCICFKCKMKCGQYMYILWPKPWNWFENIHYKFCILYFSCTEDSTNSTQDCKCYEALPISHQEYNSQYAPVVVVLVYVLVKTWAADLYLIYKLEPKARVCISDKDRMRMF